MKPCSLVIVQDPTNHHILLVKRRDVPVWVIPGGGIELGEAPIAAGKRELVEETGLIGENLELRGHFVPINFFTQETFLFYTSTFEGKHYPTNETEAVSFFSLENFPPSLFPLHKTWIERVLKSKEFIEGEIREVTWRTFFAYALRHPRIVLRFIWTLLTKP